MNLYMMQASLFGSKSGHPKMQTCVSPLDHASAPVAMDLHGLQIAAYSHEAELIGAKDFPPLSRTVEQVRSSTDVFFGTYASGDVVGAVSIETVDPSRVGISSLVVHPHVHRRGVGRALLRHVIDVYGHQELRVQTAAVNVPALALYRSEGFTEERRWFAGTEPLEIVALVRPPGHEGR